MIPVTPNEQRLLPYLPALDGVRGCAVIAVLLFHSDFAWAKGGHLGVTTFFVLSGFLITALLIAEQEREGSIDLRAFWVRRARRLVPAALVAVGLIAVLAVVQRQAPDRDLLGDGVASLLWVANWRFVLDGASYGDLFTGPSPFRHFWSLAVEEQFYLLFPLLVAGVFATTRDARTRRIALGAVLLVVVTISTEVAALLHEPGDEPLRAYYGTDARIAEPALGALLALLLVRPDGLRRFGGWARRAVGAAGVVSGLGLVVLASFLDVFDARLYDGGFLGAGLLATGLVAAATQHGAVATIVGSALLRGLGRISYGVYLFHWPVFLWLDEDQMELDPLRLFALRAVVTFGLALVSYALVEHPIRRGGLDGSIAGVAWMNATVVLVAVLALVAGAVTWPRSGVAEMASRRASEGVVVGGPAPAPRVPPRGVPRRAAESSAGAPAPQSGSAVAPEPPDASGAVQGGAKPSPRAPATTVREPTTEPVQGVRVAFIGDSLAENLAGGAYQWGRNRGDVIVLDLSVRSCPMSRGGQRRFAEGRPWPIPTGCDWWADPHSENWAKLRDFRPDVIVVEDGVNEVADRKLEDWPTYMKPGDPVFNTWLVSEYRALIDEVAAREIGLLLLNAPCAHWDRHEDFSAIRDPEGRVHALNNFVYREIATSATRVLDLFGYLCPGGRYSETVDGTEGARPDGFHLSERAAVRAAERFVGPAILDLVASRRGVSSS